MRDGLERLPYSALARLMAGMGRLKSIGMICASVLLALAISEVALRLLDIRYSDSFYEFDFQTGWHLRPGARGWQRSEGEALVEINSQGMRDRERSLAKAPGAYRVALLGDSFTEATQVDLEKTFGGLLEGRACADKGRLEALNFGVSGYGTAQELAVYRQQATRFSPDVVVLVFFAGNDLYNNVRDLNPSNADAAPYYQLEPDGSLSAEAPFARSGRPQAITRWVRNIYASVHANLRLAQVATEAYYQSGRGRAIAAQRAQIARQYGQDYLEWLAYAPPGDDKMRESWLVTEHLIRQFAAEVQADGRRFLLVLANAPVQVLPDAVDRRHFEQKYALSSIDYADLRLKALAEAQGVEVVWLAEALRLVAEEQGVLLHGFDGRKGIGHWNEAGHRVVADRLALAICGD